MLEEQIQMVDLHGQYLRFNEEINGAMQAVTDAVDSAATSVKHTMGR